MSELDTSQRITVLYREAFDIDMEDEISALKKVFNYHSDREHGDGEPFYNVLCTESRTSAACKNALVIGRYSVLPWYKELERDLASRGSWLINSHTVHCFIADMSWARAALVDMTPRTWFCMEDVPDNGGPYVLKGETNSKKHLWDTHMFAKNKQDAVQVMLRLQDDSLISSQQVVIREYVPLKRLETGLHGLPITEEYRFFIACGKVLAGGFYWSSHVDDLSVVPKASDVPIAFLQKVIDALSCYFMDSFYVVDVARTGSGDWIVVEINDGQMSGLSEVDPLEMYTNLRTVVSDSYK